ncbi:hypothetical protein GGR57DRAFT_502107 [Xylariaceae sp. FL1272]|nr:hypothetical protein GGR57DRAFT_502107 [Xylariaceae sp. FL1272]
MPSSKRAVDGGHEDAPISKRVRNDTDLNPTDDQIINMCLRAFFTDNAVPSSEIEKALDAFAGNMGNAWRALNLRYSDSSQQSRHTTLTQTDASTDAPPTGSPTAQGEKVDEDIDIALPKEYVRAAREGRLYICSNIPTQMAPELVEAKLAQRMAGQVTYIVWWPVIDRPQQGNHLGWCHISITKDCAPDVIKTLHGYKISGLSSHYIHITTTHGLWTSVSRLET